MTNFGDTTRTSEIPAVARPGMGSAGGRPLLSKTTGELTALSSGDPQRKLLSSLRLKVLLTVFVIFLIVVLSGFIFFLVSGIFSWLTPSMRADLEWKTKRSAIELSQAAEVGIAIDDPQMVGAAFGDFRRDPDVLALVATNAAGKVITTHGKMPGPVTALFAGKPGDIRAGAGYFVAWATTAIEGRAVGRVAAVISTARLESGEKLRRNILGVAGIGCVIAMGISLFFVNFYLGPLITLTHQSLRSSREMEIAKRIQTSILPRNLSVAPLEISAAMLPATEVGGDYYDVIPTDKGCWIGIGDVAGHGVRAGLIMMMLQSIVSALVRKNPGSKPSDILEVLNRVLYENIRHRLGSDEHVTFSLLHLQPDGRLTFAGAHEDMIVCRAATGRVERISTPGPWVGAVRSVKASAADRTARLDDGDLLVLHTDGVTEARNATGEEYGIDRLVAEVEKHQSQPVALLRQRLVESVTEWMATQHDDVTLLVLRYRPTSGA